LLALAVPATVAIAAGVQPGWLATVGAWRGWLGLGLLLAAGCLWTWLTRAKIAKHLVGIGTLLATVFAACLVPPEHAGWSFRVVLASWTAIGLTMTALRDRTATWFGAVGSLIAALTVAGFIAHPQGHPEAAPIMAGYLLAAAFPLRRDEKDSSAT